MRKIIIFLFISQNVFAAATTVSTQIDVQNTQSPLGISQLQSSPQVQNVRSSFGLTTDKLGKGFSIDAKVMMDSPDYSQVQLTNSLGSPKKLSVDYKNQFQSEGRLSFSKGSVYSSVGYFGHMSPSPYKTQGGFVEFEKGFFEKTSLVGFNYSFFEQQRPEDYFNDRDGFFKARPLVVHADQVNLYYEQILSESLKLRSQISTAKKYEERPRNYGVEIKLAYAVNSRLFARLSSSYFEENKNEPLVNERGYFKAYINQAELSFEPVYDFFTSVSYGFSAEIESDPRSQTTTQVGVDQYGMGLKYNFKATSVYLNGSITRSNSLTSSQKISTGLIWAI